MNSTTSEMLKQSIFTDMDENLSTISSLNMTTLMANTTVASNIITPVVQNYTYCGPNLIAFHSAYAKLHGYLSLFVCIFGSVANSLNIAILTRREMRSPTNLILTGLAVADLLVMLEYIPYASHMYLLTNRPRLEQFSYGWSLFVLFHSIFTQVCHTISIWLTVTLAVWRYIAVAYPQKNREWCRMETTIAAIISAYIVCPLLCIPLYLTFSLSPKVEQFINGGHKYNSSTYNATIDGPTFNATIYVVKFSDVAEKTMLQDIDFWIYSVVIKIIPCIALTVLSRRLIMALIETKKRRQALSQGGAISMPLTSKAVQNANSNTSNNTLQLPPMTIGAQTSSSSGTNGDVCKIKKAASSVKKNKKNARLLDKEKQTDRTTRMLLAVLLLFLITEFPQGILGLLSVIFGVNFFLECYVNLGKFFFWKLFNKYF